jgi:heme A synthase
MVDSGLRPNLPLVRSLSRFAWSVLIFNLGVILLGALVRSTGSGAGCGRSWPVCQGEVLPTLEGATAIEFIHRAASGISLILVASLTIWVWRKVPAGEPARKGAVIAVASILGEALIGAMIVLAEWVADDTSVARVVAVPLHLVNTLLLLASLALTAFWLAGGRPLSPQAHSRTWRWVALGGSALVVLAATGAVTALADTLFPETGGVVGSGESHFLTDLRIIHPILAVTAATIGWILSGRSSEGRRSAAGQALPVLVGLMLVSGSLNILLGVPIWLQLLHLFLADMLWITFVLVSAQALQVPSVVTQPA